MAYAFSGSGQYLITASTPVTALPLTIAAWFNKTGTAIKNGVFLRATTTAYAGFYFGGSSSLRGYVEQSGSKDDWSAGTYTTGQWMHACLSVGSDTSRTMYLDGAGTNGSGTSRSFTLSLIEIGAANGGTTFDGMLAEVGVWNVALSQSDVTALARGVSPALVKPQSLQFYAPLIRDLVDVRQGLAITNNSATVGDHPRIYL